MRKGENSLTDKQINKLLNPSKREIKLMKKRMTAEMDDIYIEGMRRYERAEE